MNGEQWLPARATYSASARVMLVKVLRIGGTLEFSDYRKFSVQTDTKIATASATGLAARRHLPRCRQCSRQ